MNRNELVRKTAAAAILSIVVNGLVGCNDPSHAALTPLAPSSVPLATPPPLPLPTLDGLAIFTDSATGFSTTDIHDVDGEVIRVNTANELIWMANGMRFSEFIAAAGNAIGYHHANDTYFQIRFGTKAGERRAYVTWPDRRLQGTATILDLWVDARGDLKVGETSVAVP